MLLKYLCGFFFSSYIFKFIWLCLITSQNSTLMISAFQTHLEKGRVIWDLELLLSVRFPVEIFKLLFQRFGDAWFTFNCILCIWVFYLVLVVPSEAREGVGSFGSGSTGGCELQCGCRGWNLLGHLEEHGLTVKPWIRPNIYFY